MGVPPPGGLVHWSGAEKKDHYFRLEFFLGGGWGSLEMTPNLRDTFPLKNEKLHINKRTSVIPQKVLAQNKTYVSFGKQTVGLVDRFH